MKFTPAINPMELYHNQVTRGQGSFSLRSFHRSWGILMIQGNISAPCAVLDFPTRDTFARELTAHHYDIRADDWRSIRSKIAVNFHRFNDAHAIVRSRRIKDPAAPPDAVHHHRGRPPAPPDRHHLADELVSDDLVG